MVLAALARGMKYHLEEPHTRSEPQVRQRADWLVSVHERGLGRVAKRHAEVLLRSENAYGDRSPPWLAIPKSVGSEQELL